MKSKWIKDLNIRLDTINILKENVGSKVLDISCGSVFSDMSPWARVKKKTNHKQMGLHQIKKFLHSEGNNQQNEKRATLAFTFHLTRCLSGQQEKSIPSIRYVRPARKINPKH